MDNSSIYNKLDNIFEAFIDVKPQELAPTVPHSELTASIARNVYDNAIKLRRPGHSDWWDKEPEIEVGKKLTPNGVQKVKNTARSASLNMRRAGQNVTALDDKTLVIYSKIKELGLADPIKAIDIIEKAVVPGLMNVKLTGNPEQDAMLRINAIAKIAADNGINRAAAKTIVAMLESDDITQFAQSAANYRAIIDKLKGTT